MWILGAVDGGIPHQRILDAGDAAALEEERRLFYVGMTRAKDELTISAPQMTNGAPARFVVEAGLWTPPPPSAPQSPRRPMSILSKSSRPEVQPPLATEDYAPGILCQHAQFGDGVIHEVDEEGRLVEVRFSSGPRVLSLDVCVAKGLLRCRG